jgi:hypothetical protein
MRISGTGALLGGFAGPPGGVLRRAGRRSDRGDRHGGSRGNGSSTRLERCAVHLDGLGIDPDDRRRPPAALERWDCPAGTPGGAACYRVDVPADWSQPDGTTVSLPVAVLPATGAARQPDAIVVPAGGPGFDGLGDADYYSTSPLRACRDIVLYDQRGTGRPSRRWSARSGRGLDGQPAAGRAVRCGAGSDRRAA